MPLNDDDAFKLELAINGAKESPEKLTEWESGFIASMEAKIEEYGRNAFVSEKQQRFIDQIYDKVVPNK